MPTAYTFARASDRAIIDFFQAVRLKDRAECPNVSLGDHLNFPLPADGSIPPNFANVLGASHLIRSVHYSIPNTQMSIEFQRSGESTFIDKILYNLGQNVDQHRIEIFFKQLQGSFNAELPVSLTHGAQGALDQSQAILNRVSEAAALIAEHTAGRQKEIDAQIETLRGENAIALERSRAELQADFDDRLKALDEREKLIAEREDTIDDRQNTHVRRDIQKEMAGLPAEIMDKSLLGRSSAPFLNVLFIALAVSMLLATGAAVTGLALTKDTPPNQLLFLEMTRVLLGLGGGAGFWFAIRHAANRYQQVVRWEQQLNTFRLDVERASFLIEGDLEARKLGAGGLPEIMQQAFSRGLFTGDKTEQQEDTVGSAMVHLLSRPASLKIGPAGAEASFDKAGLKKSGKEIEGKAD